MKHMTKSLLDYLQPSLGADFPENMYKCFVINVPSVFHMAWKVIQPMLDPGQLRKVSIMGSDLKDLKTLVPESRLPKWLGGSNPEHGLVDLTAVIRKEIIAAGQTLIHEVSVEKVVKARWEVKPVNYDIFYKIVHKQDTGSIIILQESTKVISTESSHKGEVLIEKKGTVCLLLDNSHTSWYSKTVHFELSLDDV